MNNADTNTNWRQRNTEHVPTSFNKKEKQPTQRVDTRMYKRFEKPRYERRCNTEKFNKEVIQQDLNIANAEQWPTLGNSLCSSSSEIASPWQSTDALEKIKTAASKESESPENTGWVVLGNQ